MRGLDSGELLWDFAVVSATASWSTARSGLLDVPQEAIDLLAVYQEAAVSLF